MIAKLSITSTDIPGPADHPGAGHHGTAPLRSKNPPVGPSEPIHASRTIASDAPGTPEASALDLLRVTGTERFSGLLSRGD